MAEDCVSWKKDALVVLLSCSTCLKLQLDEHMTCRILIVEDDPKMVTSLIDVLHRELGEVDVLVSGFEEAPGKIADEMPDVVVLDIFDDQIAEHPEDAVKPTWHFVWDKHFCPVVFHSAHDLPEYKNLNHPFTRYEIKA